MAKICYNAIHASCFEFMKTKNKIAKMLQSVPLGSLRNACVFQFRVCAYLYMACILIHWTDCSK